jgi:hypothetical protein
MTRLKNRIEVIIYPTIIKIIKKINNKTGLIKSCKKINSSIIVNKDGQDLMTGQKERTMNKG